MISINTSNQVNSNDIFQDEDLYDNEIEISSDNENKIEEEFDSFVEIENKSKIKI